MQFPKQKGLTMASDGLQFHKVSRQRPESPTLKQHIQTIWYTYHRRMDEVILTLSFEDLGFHLGFRVLGFVVLESKENLTHAQVFEHVKGYAGLAAGKPGGCSAKLSSWGEETVAL